MQRTEHQWLVMLFRDSPRAAPNSETPATPWTVGVRAKCWVSTDFLSQAPIFQGGPSDPSDGLHIV